ncbi:MAG TPA: bifunctional 4-hydroxy-2-oxoglutarate aldolase/2-dehydro-3-deoxy-phosphogluconate aldolase [Verrucomicrobiae bacterium]|jgi:2-dehydro-3-deoxyphosphogluconate aldolase/(4S)-4-hydroxy-2-oxoglutarate aldolase|nr:bifunctional 4-hydroxy-2-oxoglutarate aldolase/2-dehydro-3-deoxy-phosphogluconate aldolase [Verrucomicrobiae bacterium]
MSEDTILELPLIGILRGFDRAHLQRIVPAVLRGGLKNLEITMNSPGAAEQIEEAIVLAEGALNIGAGTVTSTELFEEGLEAGASFIVTPTFSPEVIGACAERNVPIFPGALSPTEIYSAWEMGATMVKIFPAELGGSAFVRALKGPFPGIKLLPTGGVDLETLPAFVKAGADGFGIGSPLFNRERIEAEDWTWIEKRCRAFVETYRKVVAH